MWQGRLEKLFSFKKTILLIVFMLTLLFAYSAKNISVDFDFDPNVSNVVPSRLEQFFIQGNQKKHPQVITVVAHDANLFTSSHLQRLKALELEISKISEVKQVDSLYNIPDLDEYFNSENLQPMISGEKLSDDELAEIKYQATRNKLLLNRFINQQATTMAFYVELKPIAKKQLVPVRNKIEQVLHQYQSQFNAIYQVSPIEIEYYSARDSLFDGLLLGSIAVLLLITIYGICFKKIILGLVPFISSLFALIWTAGLLACVGIPINVLSLIVLVLLFVIGAMECAHLISAYQHSCQKNLKLSSSAHAAYALKRVFWPVMLAMLTTVLGFLFNIFSDIELLEDFAFAISIAIGMNAVIICFFVPVLLSLLTKLPQITSNPKSIFNGLVSIVLKLHHRLVKQGVVVFLVMFAVVTLGIFLALRIPVEVTSYINFYADSPLMQKLVHTEKYLTGARKFSIYLQAGGQAGFDSPKSLAKIFTIEQAIQALPETSSTLSVASLSAAVNQVYVNEEGERDYQVPESERFISTILANLHEIPFVGQMLANDNKVAKVTVYYQVYSTVALEAYLTTIKQILNASSLEYQIENTTIGAAKDIEHLLKIQLVSIFLIYLLVFAAMSVIFKTYRAGVVSIIPNLFPLAGILVFMYCASIPFFPITIVVLAAVLGLAVDDTIHIMLSFRDSYKTHQNTSKAIEIAVTKQMRPVTITTLTLAVAMAVLVFSSFKSVMLFSVLLIYGAILAWISDMLVTPFLLKKINITHKISTILKNN